MALPIITEDNEVWFYDYTGVGPLPFTFVYFQKEDLNVDVDGVTLPRSAWDDTPNVVAGGGGYDGGSITLNTAVASADIRIWRDTNRLRASQFGTGGAAPGQVDTELNRLVTMAQDTYSYVARVVGAVSNTALATIIAGLAGKLDIPLGSYAALTAVASLARYDGLTLYVKGRLTGGDGGEGWWRFDAGSSATANGGTILAPDSGTGRWFRIDTRVLKPRQFPALGDATADDSAALQSLIGALVDGSVVDGEGRTYKVVTDLLAYKSSGAPDNVTWRKCNFLAGGSASASVMKVFGSAVGLTSVGTILAGATTITATGAVAGDAGKWLWLASTDKTAPVKADSYVSGELVQIRSVSGTTITLETPTKLAYSTAVTATLVTPIKNWRFENCYVVGDATKTQRGIQFFRAENCFTDTRGLNVGDATVVFEQTANCRFQHWGGNPGITADNGFDYGVVEAASVGLSGYVNGYEYRHAFASGGTSGISLLGTIEVEAESMKDAAFDCHPNVLAVTAKVATRRPRVGGAFSNQPVGLAWQGGGYLDADVTVDGYATSAVLIQPHMATANDVIKVRGQALNPTSAATRGVECDLYKAGGSIKLLDIEFDAPGLTAAGSRGVNIDTNNCASGVSINTVRVRGLLEAVVYGAVLICRAGHSVVCALFSGKATVTTTGGFGWAMLGTSNNIASGKFECHTNGAAGVKGVRADNVVHSTAVGCRALDVGGAGLSTNAEVTITLSVGGSFT